MKKEEKIIIDTDDNAATFQTLSGWVSRDGRFFGNDERAARYSGCTHHSCECGKIAKKGWIKCDECNSKIDREKYFKMPLKDYTEGDIVFSRTLDKYFFDISDLEEYLEDQELNANQIELQLIVCVPGHLFEIREDYWYDILPEDGEIPEALKLKLEEINTFLKTLPPVSWWPGKTRTEYTPKNQ